SLHRLSQRCSQVVLAQSHCFQSPLKPLAPLGRGSQTIASGGGANHFRCVTVAPGRRRMGSAASSRPADAPPTAWYGGCICGRARRRPTVIGWLMRLLLWRFARRAGPVGLLTLLGGPF